MISFWSLYNGYIQFSDITLFIFFLVFVFMTQIYIAQSAGTVEYNDCISEKE